MKHLKILLISILISGAYSSLLASNMSTSVNQVDQEEDDLLASISKEKHKSTTEKSTKKKIEEVDKQIKETEAKIKKAKVEDLKITKTDTPKTTVETKKTNNNSKVRPQADNAKEKVTIADVVEKEKEAKKDTKVTIAKVVEKEEKSKEPEKKLTLKEKRALLAIKKQKQKEQDEIEAEKIYQEALKDAIESVR